MLLTERSPAISLIEFGEKLRSSTSVRDGEFKIINLTEDGDLQNLKIFIKAGEEYTSDPQPLFMGFTYETVPQVAVWLESIEGEFIETLYVTSKASNSGFQSASIDQSKIIRRPEALPYWGHRRGIKSQDGLYIPDVGDKSFDGMTSATPKGDYQLIVSSLIAKSYKIFMEVNRSYDFNEFYSKDRFPDDEVYSGSGSSGQPSLIYEATLYSEGAREYFLKLVGHGHHSGRDGELYDDLTNIDSAKEILDFVVVKIID